MIPMARPAISNADREAVLRILDSGYWASGPEVRAFEQEFAELAGVKHAIAVTNGTVALHAALLSVGVEPGDVVVTTPFTFIATSNTILHCHAKPHFVDIDPDTFLIDIDQVEKALQEQKVKAVVVVHLFGQMCDMGRLRSVCDAAGVALVEDCAQAHGAAFDGAQAGSVGEVGTFSFYATKNLPTGEGGMVTTQDDERGTLLRQIINHGRTGGYEHAMVGYNYRMTNILAALGRTQMTGLHKGNERRVAIASKYLEQITNPVLRHPTVAGKAGHVFHQYTLRCADRDEFQQHLKEQGVGSAIIYPLLSYQQLAYQKLGHDNYSLPHAEKAVQEVLSIPVFPTLTDSEVGHIIDACNSFAPSI